MKPLHLLLLGGATVAGLVLLSSGARTSPGPSPGPSPPAPPPGPTPPPEPPPSFVVPASSNTVSRTGDPPAGAVVPPGLWTASFDVLGLSSGSVSAPSAAGIPSQFAAGTMLAQVSLRNRDVLFFGADTSFYRVVWVSPDGQRVAFLWKDSAGFGLPDGVYIAHR